MARPLRDFVSEWADWDAAAHALSECVGLTPLGSAMREFKAVYWSANPVGDNLRVCLDALVAAGALERRDEPDTQYRWRAGAGPADEAPIPRHCSLVRFRFDLVPPDYHARYPFTPDGVYVFLGDIPNLPGHCAVADHRTGRVYSGYHTEWFAEVPADE